MLEDLKATMRQQELQRRAVRRAYLLNEAKLLEEALDEEGKAAHKAAVEAIKEQKLNFEREITPGYWQRLWRALLNR